MSADKTILKKKKKKKKQLGQMGGEAPLATHVSEDVMRTYIAALFTLVSVLVQPVAAQQPVGTVAYDFCYSDMRVPNRWGCIPRYLRRRWHRTCVVHGWIADCV